jgi:glycosyltransferase involved in cell wall biosynthesis
MLSAMDVFCLPSFSEGLPVSLLEAMAAGVPVVGSEVAGIREVITHGKTGLLFPCDDDRRLASALLELAQETEMSNMLAANALERVMKQYSNTSWLVNYEEVLAGNLEMQGCEGKGIPAVS